MSAAIPCREPPSCEGSRRRPLSDAPDFLAIVAGVVLGVPGVSPGIAIASCRRSVRSPSFFCTSPADDGTFAAIVSRHYEITGWI